MNLYSVLEEKVNHGELTWEQILMEIHVIKKEKNFQKISDVSLIESFSGEEELSLVSHPSATPFQLVARKEITEKMSNNAKIVMGVITSHYHEGKPCTKTSWYKEARRYCKRGQILKAKQELSKIARDLEELDW